MDKWGRWQKSSEVRHLAPAGSLSEPGVRVCSEEILLILQSPLSTAVGVTGFNNHTQVFTRVLRIRTQVLMLVQQVFSFTKSSLQAQLHAFPKVPVSH